MEPLFYRIVRPLLRILFLIIYKPTYVGQMNIPKSGCVVLAGNHTNNLDCLALISATKRPIHFLGKHTLFRGMKRFIFKGMGVIPVDRTKSSNHEALESAIEVLKNGSVVGIFPEGTINRTEEVVMPFKIGAVKMASSTGAVVVPFAITGDYRPFRRGLKIIFGKAISVTGDLNCENEKLSQEVIRLIREE